MASLRPCAPFSGAVRSRKPVVVFCKAPTHHTTATQPRTAAPLVLAAVATLLTASPASAAEAPELFANKCAGCHMNGGNVLAVGATLFPEDLRRNGVDSAEALYKIIYSGKGKMPGFGKDCAPKGACTFGPRLTDEEVAGLATYVQERAAAGWKQ